MDVAVRLWAHMTVGHVQERSKKKKKDSKKDKKKHKEKKHKDKVSAAHRSARPQGTKEGDGLTVGRSMYAWQKRKRKDRSRSRSRSKGTEGGTPGTHRACMRRN